jgi:predicted RNase H-like HicB family nuclease
MAKKREQKLFLYPVEIESLEEGGFFASCPSLQGCHAQGNTYSETIESMEDVIKAHLELRREHNEIVFA